MMEVLAVAYESYYVDNGKPPASSENYRLAKVIGGEESGGITYLQLSPHYVNANKEFIDGWGTPFRFTFLSKDNILIESAGPDQIFGTPDDITNQ